MYIAKDFERLGVGFHPVASGMYVGNGTAVDWLLIPRQMIFSFTVEGTCFEKTENREFLVRPGEVVCLWPGKWHKLTEYRGEPLKTIWLNLTGPAIANLPPLFGVSPEQMVCTPGEYRESYAVFTEIMDACNSDEQVPPSHFLSRFFRLAEYCEHHKAATSHRDHETLVERAARICRQEVLKFPTVPELALRLGVCQNTFLNACRRELGITAAQLLLNLKIERAKELLLTTDCKLIYIAKSCGFSSSSHFIGCFRQAEEMTPAIWRQTHR